MLVCCYKKHGTSNLPKTFGSNRTFVSITPQSQMIDHRKVQAVQLEWFPLYRENGASQAMRSLIKTL